MGNRFRLARINSILCGNGWLPIVRIHDMFLQFMTIPWTYANSLPYNLFSIQHSLKIQRQIRMK